MFIQNVSLSDITTAWHFDPGPNSVCIQIVDPDMEWPTPLFQFAEIHRFKFLDIEETDEGNGHITMSDAAAIVDILMKASRKRSNVIVHCHAGICRSGAVAEFAISRLGFDDTDTFRQPNLLVKRLLNRHFDSIVGNPDVSPFA
jgi:predicted protein tyrosine phosphatase